MRRFFAPTVIIATVAGLLIILQLLALFPNVSTPLIRVELSNRDLLMRLRPTPPRSGQIAIVAIDDASFNWTGYRWPWPRAYMAKIVDRLNQAGASVIGLDAFLFAPDADPTGDPALSKAFAESKASVGVANIFRTKETTGGITLESETVQLPLEPYQKAFTRIGITPTTPDVDAILREVQVYDQVGDDTYTNWAFEAASLFQNTPAPANYSQSSVQYNGRSVPLSGRRMLVNYAGPAGTYPTYSAYSVVEGDIPDDAFRGKIVFIGATSPSLQDLWPTPYSSTDRTPGVEVVANAVDTVLTERYLQPAPAWASLLETLLMALIAGLILRLREPVRVLGTMAAVLVVFVVAVYLLLQFQGIVLDLVAPALMLFAGVVLPTMGEAVSQELEKRHLRSLFGRFLSGDVIDQMVSATDLSALNKRTNITILFSDVRGFTTLSESLTPEQVVAVLNPYLEAMGKIIDRHGGTIDKYEGDAIMAFFGEPIVQPDHALRAARTAVDMLLAMDGLRQSWHARGVLPQQANFQIGVGLNSGEAFVGMLGSEQRINYTAIGDNVNLSSRLQDLTKTYKWPILISGATYELVKDEFEAEHVDDVIVKGKSEAVAVYKVLGRKGAPESERVQALELPQTPAGKSPVPTT
jgi:adenylate cyclase